MSEEEEAMNNDVSVSITTTTQKTSESPISKAMAAHLESLMQGDEADDLGLASAPILNLGPEADEDEEWLDNDLTMDESAYADVYADADADVEVEAEAHASTITIDEPISIPIIFGNSSKGGAWDDRDLVKAFDAAKEEFHLHNPGPGSWLDKVTAGLAKGKPLAGAEYGETKWYTSYDPVEDPNIPRLPKSAQASSSASGSANQTGKKEKGGKKRKRVEGGGVAAGNVAATTGDLRNNQNQNKKQAQTQTQGKRVRIDDHPVPLGSIVNPYLPYNSSSASGSASLPNNNPAQAWSSRTNNPYLPNPTFASTSASAAGQGYRPVVPDYQPTSPVYTPASPNYQPGELLTGQIGEDEEGRGTGMEVDDYGRTIPNTRTGAGTGEGGKRLLGPVIPDAARYQLHRSTVAGGSTGTGGADHGRRLPNYAGLASPSASPPPANSRGEAYQGPQQAYQPKPVYRVAQPQPSQARPRAPQQDPTYDATSSGVYPSMGTSGFSSGVEMNREVAVSRAVNAQWWAGYWFAMSEVLPPSEGQ